MKMMSARRVGLIAAFIVTFGGNASANENEQKPILFDPDCYGCTSELFMGVKQTYIAVNYRLIDQQQGEDLPPSLRRENIEKLILAAYRHRFSKTECKEPFEGKGRTFTYGCNDQPVNLAKDGDFNEANLAKPGTLAIAFDIKIDGRSQHAVNNQSGLVAAFHISQQRLDKHLRYTSFPQGLSSSLPDSVYQKKIAQVHNRQDTLRTTGHDPVCR